MKCDQRVVILIQMNVVTSKEDQRPYWKWRYNLLVVAIKKNHSEIGTKGNGLQLKPKDDANI